MNTMNTKTIRILASLSAVATSLALADNAHSETSAQPAVTGPTFADLPVGRLTTPPAKKADWVGARDTVPGLYVVSPSFNNMVPAAQRQTAITADPVLAAGIKSGQGRSSGNEVPLGCVSTDRGSRNPFGMDTDETRNKEWAENLSGEATAYPRSADNPMSGVIAVHSERLVEQNGSTTLESVDAWVDPATRGVKLISKASLPLKLVRGPTFGIKVFAGRDERPDGKRFVQFVVVRPAATQDTAGRTSQMWSMRTDGSVNHASGCGHARVSLPADGKSGDMATVVATVLLPSLDGNDASPSPAAPPKAKTPATPPTPPTAKGGVKLAAPAPAPKPFPFSAPNPKEREIRTRTMHIQLSVSQTSREKDPLVSVSSVWANREQIDRAVDPVGAPDSPF